MTLEIEYELKDKRELSTFEHIHFKNDYFLFSQQLKPWSTCYRRSRLTE
jgi:hypothetical protein